MRATTLPSPLALGPVRLGPELKPFSIPGSPPLACAAFPDLSDVLREGSGSLVEKPALGVLGPITAPRGIHVVVPRGRAHDGSVACDTGEGSGPGTPGVRQSSGSWAAVALLSASEGASTSDVGSAMDALWSGECDARSIAGSEGASPPHSPNTLKSHPPHSLSSSSSR